MPTRRHLVVLAACALLGFGCHSKSKPTDATPKASGSAGNIQRPVSSVIVSHGQLDTVAPEESKQLAATVIAGTIYKLTNVESRRLGYVRLGRSVRRDDKPAAGPSGGCKSDWYRVYPIGYACTDEFTTDLSAPLVRAAGPGPDLSRPLPYHYGFVRATSPQYLRIPTKEEQEKSEFKLDDHLQWYAAHKAEVQSVILGANDVPLDEHGIAQPGLKQPASFRPSTSLSLGELTGGKGPNDPIAFWLADGKRSIPNVSGFDVPDYAVFADRVRRKTGLSLIGSFNTSDHGFERRFAITVDLRLVPTSKIKPDTGSPFHGLSLTPEIKLPFAWVLFDSVNCYRLNSAKDEAHTAEPLPKRAIIPLTGRAQIAAGHRYYQSSKDESRWLAADQIGIVALPETWPEPADKGQKWIDISLRQQTLVLYEGKKPVYATLVSTGRDRLGDPETTLSTPQGSFRIKSKHIAAAMDSEENSNMAGGTRANTSSSTETSAERKATVERLLAAERAGKTLSSDDQRRLANIKKGRDPEYGVTRRRGSRGFELRDVPWIQYFASGYAIHGAYWHDAFGIPRSHGCVNLSPIDAHYVFFWTDPPVPDGWHGINVGSEMGDGTAVVIHE